MAEVLHQGIRGSSFEIIPNARHLTPLECPQKIATILQALLSVK
jgi:3-oxoadipate enol-lactonase